MVLLLLGLYRPWGLNLIPVDAKPPALQILCCLGVGLYTLGQNLWVTKPWSAGPDQYDAINPGLSNSAIPRLCR